MATVFSNDMTAHVWAQQSQESGQSYKGSIYFHGPALYSYGSHYLAGFVLPSGTAFINRESRSNATSKHTGSAMGAVGYARGYWIPDLTILGQHLRALHDGRVTDSTRQAVRSWAADHVMGHGEAVRVVLSEFRMARSFDKIERDATAAAKREAKREAKAEREAMRTAVREYAALTGDGYAKALRRRIGDIRHTYSVTAFGKAEGLKLLRALKFANANDYQKRTCDRLRDHRRVLADIDANFESIHSRASNRRDTKKIIPAAKHCREALAGRVAFDTETIREALGYDPSPFGVGRHSEHADSAEDGRELALIYSVYIANRALECARIGPALRRRLKFAVSTWSPDAEALQEARYKRSDERRAANCYMSEVKRAEVEAKRHADWLAGARVSPPYNATDAGGGVLIRAMAVQRDESGAVTGGRLETSQRAHVPLVDAIAAYRRVTACRKAGRSWERNGERFRVAEFQIDRVEASGNFKAGCHNFTWETINALAVTLGVAV